MQINELGVGAKVRITALAKGQEAYRQRLIALGLLPGTVFTLIRIAPLGDPFLIRLRGFALSLRKAEASLLQLEEVRS